MEKAQVLIVEDDAIIAMDIESQLKQLGYGVDAIVGYGEEAIDKVKENKPDVVLMDIVLKGDIDGIEAAEEIRTQFDIPVIFLTAFVDKDRLERAKLTYPFGFILKPSQNKDLSVTIEMALYVAKVDAERKQVEKSLQESEEIHRVTLVNISDAVFLTDDTGAFTFICPNVDVIFGYSEEEVRSLDNISKLLGANYYDPNELGALGEIRNIEIEIIDKAGKKHDLLVNVKGVSIKGGTKLITCRDITERKQVEESLRKSEERFRVLTAMSPTGIYQTDVKGDCIYVNQRWCEMTGFSPEEAAGQSWMKGLHPEDRELIESEWYKMVESEGKWGLEYRFQNLDGKIIWAYGVAAPLRDDDGTITGYMGVNFDNTERKALEEELLKSRKLESVSILAGGIAHDFNNLLSIIMGNISMTKDDVKPEYGVTEFLNEAEKASFQAQELTKQLITFSKGGAPVKKIGPIGNLIKETTNFSILGSDVECEFFIPHDHWLIEFDEGQVKHAINNMVVNAVESMPDGGTINVRAENCEISPETVAQSLPLPEGKYIKISIRDQGVGIPGEHLSMIFDPYFSTKEMGIQKGMGLGLATTYSIISRHDGHINVESEVGVGTTFTIYLPVAVKEIAGAEPAKRVEPEKPAIHTGRILLMDDEKSIRKVTKQMLSRLGYDPGFAKDGTEAIELFKGAIDSGTPFDLVILDLTIKGGMGGVDTIQKLLEIDPQVKAIVSSGYSNDPIMTNFGAYGFIGALPKPYKKKDLSNALNKVLMGES